MESILGNHDIVFGLGDSIIHTLVARGILLTKSYEFDDKGTLLSMYK